MNIRMSTEYLNRIINTSIAVFILVISVESYVFAEEVFYYDGKAVLVQASVGRVSEISFPHKVARIVKGGAQDSLLIEVMDNSIFLLPKSEEIPDVFVTTVDGENYPLHLSISNEYQSKLRVIDAFGDEASQRQRNNFLNLMKLMMQGRVPKQATVLNGEEKRIIANNSVELQLRTIFMLTHLKGLVLTARNLTQAPIMLSIEAITYPGLLAIASDNDYLEAQGAKGSQTTVYMVVKQ